MADLLWEDVVEITQEDAEQGLLTSLDEAGLTTTSWQPFSFAPIVVEIGGEFRVEMSKVAVFLKKSFMSETATGQALTELSRSFYANVRESAVEAQHLITLACAAGAGPHSIDLGELTFVDPVSGETFRNVAGNNIAYPYNLTAGTSVTLLCEAEIAGTDGNTASAQSAADVKFELQTTMAGVSITSHTLERSGLEEETDARLNERNQLKWSLLSELGVIDEGVQAIALKVAPAVTSVAVDSSNPRGVGTFDVYCAGLDATASDDDVSAVQIGVDLKTMGRNNTPKTALVYPAPEVLLDITGNIYISGVTPTTVATAVEDALIEFVRSIPPGGFKYTPGPSNVVAKNDIESVIRQAVLEAGATKVTVSLSIPVSDLAVTFYGKVIRGTWNLSYVPVTL